MIRIQIGSSENERTIGDIDESWINQQINRRRHDQVPICVKVFIQENGLDLLLATCDCPRTGPGRRPTSAEEDTYALWVGLGLNKPDFTGGQLVAFLKRLR